MIFFIFFLTRQWTTCIFLHSMQVDVAELKQKLLSIEGLQKEVELLRREKSAVDEAAARATQKQSSGGVWSWIAGTPSVQDSV